MDKVQLCFSIELKWQQTVYDNLKDLALFHNWVKGAGTSLWVFRMKDLKQVELLLGRPVLIPEYREMFDREKVVIKKERGEGSFEINVLPTIYEIIEYRKVEIGPGEYILKVSKPAKIPKALVDEIYKQVIAHMPLNKPIKTKTVAENTCRVFNLTRFFRDSGEFDFQKYFGERKREAGGYFTYTYNPCKVLHWLGKIRHHKCGKIERLV